MYSKRRKLAAEFLGTFGLVLFSTGAICSDQFLRSANQPRLGVLGIALAYGLAAGGLFTALGHVSGGHFNPAVTIGSWATRKLGTFDTLTYVAAQLSGAAAASYALRYVVPDETWGAVMLGTPALANGLTRGPAMLIEGFLTLFLFVVVFSAAPGLPPIVKLSGDQRLGSFAGPAVGFVVAAGAIFGGPFTGGIMNPARAFGPALAAHHWTNQGVYWVGPLAGAMVGAVLCDFLFRPLSRPS